MNRSLREEAVLVAERLRSELEPSTILLFGSAARGAETETSDIDLCLLFEEMPGRKLDVLRKARRLARPLYKGAMDVVAYSREEWLAYLAAGSSFEIGLEKEAISL
jgi:predicted nucleotidyltransferase